MRHHVALARQNLGAEAADARIDVALFGVNRFRFGQVVAVGARQHAIDGIGQVDRGRTRFANALRGRVEGGAGMQLRGQRDAVGPEDADRRGAADRQGANRIDDTVDVARALAHDRLRQRTLVEIPDGVTVDTTPIPLESLSATEAVSSRAESRILRRGRRFGR